MPLADQAIHTRHDQIIYRYDPLTQERLQPPATPAEAVSRLCQGNREFVGLVDVPNDGTPSTRVIPFDLSEFGLSHERGAAPRQHPFAVVLGCHRPGLPRRSDAVVEPARTNVLLGAIVLEAFDLLVDCPQQKLHPRDPDHIIAEIE